MPAFQFDPFSSQPNAANAAPTLQSAPGAFPSSGSTVYPPPPTQTTIPPGYPGYPAQPPYQYSGGGLSGSGGVGQSGGLFSGLFGGGSNIGTPLEGPYTKLLDDLRLRYTWIAGSGPREVEVSDVDASVTLNWPNFLHSGQPLSISPGFSFHFWDGPSLATSNADLPGRAYSAFLDLSWTSNTQVRSGVEANFVGGVYSDFTRTLTSDSLRFMGTGLGWMRLSESLWVKGGVTYIDRNDIKLLPAAGVFYYPSEDIRFEFYFPRPKFAQRMWTVGNTDIWGYLGGEYGGGSWTVVRARGTLAGTSEQVDINELRVFMGLEWLSGYVGVNGFLEVGYVFDRELVYKRADPRSLPLKDAMMLRAGISF